MSIVDAELRKKRYPHMMAQEIRIWKKFLKKHGQNFTKFKYDVHVGRGVGTVPGFTPVFQKMAITLTQKRIDVVAGRGSDVWIIEIKDRAGMSAIGQLLTYRELYFKRFGFGRVTGLIVVAESTDPDVVEVLARFKIRIFIV